MARRLTLITDEALRLVGGHIHEDVDACETDVGCRENRRGNDWRYARYDLPTAGSRLSHRRGRAIDAATGLNRTEFIGGLFPREMEPMGRPSKYSPEVRERAVRMVFDHAPEHPSQWAAIRSVGEKLGIRTESLRRWVRQAERDVGTRPGLTTTEREELKRLQREVVELKRANEILKKAAAFFAQAELDRRAK